METDLYFPSSHSATWTSTSTPIWIVIWVLFLLSGILLFLLFLYFLHMNAFQEEGHGNQALLLEYTESNCAASRSSFSLQLFLQESLNKIAMTADIRVRLEKEEKEESFPRQWRQGCGLNSKKPIEIPDIDQETPGHLPVLSIDNKPEQFEETIKSVETTIPRPESEDSLMSSELGSSQFINELFNLWDPVTDERPTMSSLLGEKDVGKSPLKDYPHRESKLQLEEEPQSQTSGSGTEGFSDSYSFSSKDSEPEAPRVCRGDMATFQALYILLEDTGSDLGQVEQRDPRVQGPWMVQDTYLEESLEIEDPETFPSIEYLEGDVEPQKGQGPQKNKTQKRFSRVLQWFCLGRKGNRQQASPKSAKAVLDFQQFCPCHRPSTPPSKRVTLTRAHQQMPREPGPPSHRRRFSLSCFRGCISRNQS